MRVFDRNAYAVIESSLGSDARGYGGLSVFFGLSLEVAMLHAEAEFGVSSRPDPSTQPEAVTTCDTREE